MSETNAGAQARSDATAARHRSGGASPRWMAPAALVLAVIAVGTAVWAVTAKEPAEGVSEAAAGGAGEVTPEQSAAAKTRVCDAAATVTKAVQLQTFANLGPDPVAQTAVAGNARLALFGGGVYLLNRIDDATPPELAEPARKFGETLQDIGMSALTGVTNEDPVQQGRLTEGDKARQEIAALCA